MFSNEAEDKYCSQCGKIYFFYTKSWQENFCMCGMKIFLRIDQVEIKKENMHQVPQAFYEAFANEKEF